MTGTATKAMLAYGTILQASNGASPPAYLSVAQIRSINPAGMSREGIEVTHMESPEGFKEFLAGMIEGAKFNLDLNYLPADPSHQAMLANLIASSPTATKGWRVVWPDLGADSYTATVVEGTGVWTTASAHGWNTAQPVRLTTTGVLPAPLVAGRRYWARYISATTLSLFNLSADAYNNASAITLTTAGSGTHTIYGGSIAKFNGFFSGAKPGGQTSGQLTIASEMTVTGPIANSP